MMDDEKEKYESIAFCRKCGKETNHIYIMDGHERDSSYDRRVCTACGETVLGMEEDF